MPFPPGETSFSLTRTRRMAQDPLGLLLEGYERFGPVFTMRIFHGNSVFMIGPEANHHMTVSHAENFSWREGHMRRQLIPLLGDGLLTTDWRVPPTESRRIMLPAFHRRRRSTRAVDVMVAETERALRRVARRAATVDLYHWARRRGAADRDARAARARPATRAGSDRRGRGRVRARRSRSTTRDDVAACCCAGPGTPWARMQANRRRARRDHSRARSRPPAAQAGERRAMDAASSLLLLEASRRGWGRASPTSSCATR